MTPAGAGQLPVVHDVQHGEPAGAFSLFTKGTITLGWEDRLRTRARRTSDQGLPFATALARGTVLRSGDWLLIESARQAIAVVEADDPVLVIRPEKPEEWALFAYFIGNSHQPLMVAADGLVVPDLLGMSQVLEFQRIPFAREMRPFTPVAQVPSHRHAIR